MQTNRPEEERAYEAQKMLMLDFRVAIGEHFLKILMYGCSTQVKYDNLI